MVYSKLWPAEPMEFELTRNQHSKDPNLPFTISAMFKDQNDDVYVEAWRVLAAACEGEELLPQLVADMLRRVGSGCLDDQLALGAEHVVNKLAPSSDQLSPGSASMSWPKQRDTCDDSATPAVQFDQFAAADQLASASASVMQPRQAVSFAQLATAAPTSQITMVARDASASFLSGGPAHPAVGAGDSVNIEAAASSAQLAPGSASIRPSDSPPDFGDSDEELLAAPSQVAHLVNWFRPQRSPGF